MKRANHCPGLAGGPPAGEADLPSAAVAEGGAPHQPPHGMGCLVKWF